MIGAGVIAYAVKYGGDGYRLLVKAGVSEEDFVDDERAVWRYIVKSRNEHDTIPSADVLFTRFPDFSLPSVRRKDLPLLLHNLRQRSKYIKFMKAMDKASDCTSYDKVDEAIQGLMGDLNGISFEGPGRAHLVDLFSRKTNKRMLRELQERRAGKITGIPTGLPRLDAVTGGLQRQRMVVIIGRSGMGKSWMDLFFVANAVVNGYKGILYPLEMSLFETAARLYTIFSQMLGGEAKVLRNYDITSGRISPRKVYRFLMALEDKFGGQLHVADVGSLSDHYTNERIEAEVEQHQPDFFWVDYITLLKPPPGSRGSSDSDHTAVKKLSNGIKRTAMRRNCVGGCSAQVNREAIRANVFLPRLEHIAFGDSIGHDADLVIPMNRKPGQQHYLYYACAKNRGGPEFGRTRVRFHPNEGILAEEREQEEDE